MRHSCEKGKEEKRKWALDLCPLGFSHATTGALHFCRVFYILMQDGQSGSCLKACKDSCFRSCVSLILKLLSVIYKLVQSDSYATKRDIYYNDPQLFGSQTTLDSIVDDVSCMLKVPRRSLHVLATSKGFISGALCYLEEDGTKVDCSSSSTGKGVPDVNSRLMVRKLWDTLHVPVFALVDADPHGIEIMCIYKYGSLVETMQRLKQKAEIQSLASIAPHFLTRVYLPNKLRYGGWI
ncbi:meiotic recombination SPO11 [Labeo rohita]|uniref:DNA topoisomerase (ATP-hydrolyzing) n=1 Tax=Labeo rohita TaxID=84645 RepID=A0A498NGC8_LABRO|nr:meiotic recombination SPO11 [Labeo rohita]